MGYFHASKLLKLAFLSSLMRKYVLLEGFYHDFGTKKASASGGSAPWTPEVPLPPLTIYPGAAQGRRNEFRSGMARTEGLGCDPQRGSKGQSPWWGSGGKAPWKPVLKKKLNHNLYSKLIWDYYKMGCVILTRKLFNLPIRVSPLISVFFFFSFCFCFSLHFFLCWKVVRPKPHWP